MVLKLLPWALAVVICLSAVPARSHEKPAAPLASDWRPETLRDVAFQPKLGGQLPAATLFHDENGRSVSLADYFSNRPSILVFSYFDCPMLCPLILEGLAKSLKPLSLQVGRDFDVLVISIEEGDDPAAAREKKAHILSLYGRGGSASGWHFLTGKRDSIDQVTEAAGFRYAYDDKTGQYAHGSGIYILTPQGKIARVFYGVDFPSRDLRLGLVEASDGKIGTPVDQMLLYCYHYDPMTGQYGLVIMNALRIAGAAVVLALGGFIALMLRRERSAAGRGAEA